MQKEYKQNIWSEYRQLMKAAEVIGYDLEAGKKLIKLLQLLEKHKDKKYYYQEFYHKVYKKTDNGK